MIDEDRSRRRSARLNNERLKLIAAFCNTLGVASFVTLLLAPFATGRITAERGVGGILLALVLHGAGQLFLLLWQNEDRVDGFFWTIAAGSITACLLAGVPAIIAARRFDKRFGKGPR